MSNELALITGASSGIGETFAYKLAERGYDLCMIGRRKEKLESNASELRRIQGIQVDVLVADLATEAGVNIVENWIKANPAISLLINNAGYGLRGYFKDKPAEAYSEMITVQVNSVMRLTSAVLPAMLTAGRGAIINVSSIAAYLPLAGNAVYAGTKSFINTFTQALSLELKNTGVKIQLLVPGFTYSDFHKRPEYAKINTYASIPGFLWMTSEQVVQNSLSALEQNKFECIPGWINKTLVFAGKMGLSALASKIRDRQYKKSSE